MNDNIKAGADIHAGDGGYREGTKEGYEAFSKERNKSLAKGRIREIAEQCNIGKLVDTWEYQKFAEWIALECIDIANTEKVSYKEIFEEEEKNNANTYYYLMGNNGGIIDAIQAIKDYFGVNEE